jgi:thiamine-phosphate pyrophosphorylase
MGRFELSGPFAGYHYNDRNLPPHSNRLVHAVGYSAHAPDDAVSAFTHNVDFCTLSPIFATPSKVGILDPIGVRAIREARKQLPDKTIVALGGVNETNAEQCVRAGASGIAVIRAIMAAEDPETAARRLLRIVENSLQP